ncbi:invasion protein B [Paramesorhizobium deserti]|uniref:Invasion protein B n=1 Tax=Paramesorhizobium deserti TaxID=1494590 RepID=A0A135HXN5_9HYPH|nr:invasion protein B [Paramesorhizobium deserti]
MTAIRLWIYRFSLFIGISISGCFSAFAQGSETAPSAPPQPATASPAQPAAGAPHVTKFDDWYHRCVDVKAADGKTVPQCEVAQIAQVRQGEQNVNILTLAIARTAPEAGKKPSQNDLLLTALVPLNVVLPVGLGLSADGKDVVTIPYRNCNQAGCWAQQKLDHQMLGALQKGNAGEAHLRLMNGQNINLRFSLKGLTKALAELQKPSRD